MCGIVILSQNAVQAQNLSERPFTEFTLPAPVPPPTEGGRQAQVSTVEGFRVTGLVCQSHEV